MSMRIFLARPSYSSVYGLITSKTKTMKIIPPYGLLSVAASLQEAGHTVEVADCEAEELPRGAVTRRAARFGAQVFGVGAVSPNFYAANVLLRDAKKQLRVVTVLGGPHGTVRPDQVLTENPHIDFVIRGEGEITAVTLTEAIEARADLRSVKGLSFRTDGKVIHNEDQPLVEHLDELPLPARELINPALYNLPDPRFGMRRAEGVQTSRGCPFQCAFCYRMFGHRIRYRSPKAVIDEIQMCLDERGVQIIVFLDDTFTLKPDRTIEICEMMLERQLKVPWVCFARADTLREDVLRKMRQAGCVRISIGVESGDQATLDLVKKNTNLEQIRGAYAMLKRIGFESRGSFIIGLPGENRRTIRRTINFAKSLQLDRAFFNIFTPYPGTETLEDAKFRTRYRLLTQDWSRFRRYGNAVVELDEVSHKDLIDLQRVATMEFYLRGSIIYRHLFQFLRGARDPYYYRPVWFAVKERLRRTFG